MESVLFLTLLAVASASPLLNQQSRCEDSVFYTRANISTSPFVNIMNVRIDTPDAVYSTPPVLLVGKKDGGILRCRQEDPTVCEELFNTGSHVYSIVIAGEYYYAGVYSGSIYRCKLYQKDSCKIFQKGTASVESLATANGYLYAGLYNGTVLRCLLNEPNSCRPFHVPGNNIYSVISFNDKLYAGLWNGQLMSCSLTEENSCTLLYTLSAGIMGFSAVANSLFAVTWNGLLWNCTRKPDDAADFCASVSLNYSKPRDIGSFNGILYTLENEKGLYRCKWANNTECVSYGNIKNAHSAAFAYGTYEMQSRFKNEDKSCKWQDNSQCPPVVTYYNEHQRTLLEVHVKDNKLYNSFGVLVDTSGADEGRSGRAAIFAMGPDGTILLSNLHKRGLLHMSSFFAGNPVAGAGEMVVKNGVIQRISACSEHYEPDLTLNGQVIQSLRSQGYTEPIKSLNCTDPSGVEDFGQTESNDVQ